MKILKNIMLFILLTVLTFVVVFAPSTLSGQREKYIINKVFHRDYSAGNRSKITSEQVARLYYNREITEEFFSLPFTAEESNTETIREDITYFIKTVFKEEKTVCELIDSVLSDGDEVYSRKSLLVKIDNRPTALNFVGCITEKSDCNFKLFYEEKTKTPISFMYDNFRINFENTEEAKLYIKKIHSIIEGYFENQLHITKDDYYCFVDMPSISENRTNGCTASIQIGCGLLQQEIKYEEETD